MLIICPSCQAEYNVPGAVPPGRMVKCAKCQTRWAPVPLPPPPAAPEPPPPPPPPPAPPMTAEVQAPRPKRRAVSALTLAWVASGLFLLAVVAAALVWRDPVMRLWPPSQRLYGLFGLR